MYERTYTTLEPSYPGIISFVAQLALETIATSDAGAAGLCPCVHGGSVWRVGAEVRSCRKGGEGFPERRALVESDETSPISRFRGSPPSDNPTYLAQRERIYDGMRKAGVPEG